MSVSTVESLLGGPKYQVKATCAFGFLTEAKRECLRALAEFLSSIGPSGHNANLYVYEDLRIGGLRVSEISFVAGNAGGGYMRSVPDHANVILAAEQFLQTYGVKPHRPEGWSTCLNEHGESRIALMHALKVPTTAAEFSRQLEEEALIS